MKSAAEVLQLLRFSPDFACAAWGFVCRGDMLNNQMGGVCSLTCTAIDAVYKIDVTEGVGHWFIPFRQGAARYCDVPQGQPDGTLVVTFPMNGCALEVHPTADGNRFYHDSDGKHMPQLATNRKFRAVYAEYAGPNERAATIFQREYATNGAFTLSAKGKGEPLPLISSGFEHTLMCVKKGLNWHVYQTAVCSTTNMNTGRKSYWQIKNGPPVKLGSFAD